MNIRKDFMYKILIYQNSKGESEVKDYILDLQKHQNKNNKINYTKIIAYIRLLKENGVELGEPYVKHINEEIWELRPLRNRILFANLSNNIIILLSIFTKKTQKTPKKEIEKAKKFLNDYIQRSVENE